LKNISQKRQGVHIAKDELQPLLARRFLSIRISLRREEAVNVGKLILILFALGAGFFVRTARNPA